MCSQIQRNKSLDCFTNGSNFLGLLKKETLHLMILNFYEIVFIQVQWHYLIFFNRSCLVLGIFYVSHNITNFGDFFLEDFCWVETKGRDRNENSLDLMVTSLLFFMNIICVQIPHGKLYQALSSQMKRLTNYQICN
jgi:hypothetical protein